MANLAMLASDEDNPEFLGARNPDDLLYVTFDERAIRNTFQSEKEGRPIYDSIVFVKIQTPGNQLNIIERPKIKNDEFRFRRQWNYFKDTHSDDPAKQGTPLSQWPLLNVAQAEMMRALKFFTVEQIAFCSDEQIGQVGMNAGMAPMAFREKAKAFLAVARDSSVVSKQTAALAEANAKLEALQKQVEALMANSAPPAAPALIMPEPKKRHRRTKAVMLADAQQAQAPAPEPVVAEI